MAIFGLGEQAVIKADANSDKRIRVRVFSHSTSLHKKKAQHITISHNNPTPTEQSTMLVSFSTYADHFCDNKNSL